MNKEQIKKSIEDSKKIQPDVVAEKTLKNVDEKGRILYEEIADFYNNLCKKDASFAIVFLTPKELKPILFYRICDPNETNRFEDSVFYLSYKMYDYLKYTNFLNYLEKIGDIKILKKENFKPKFKIGDKVRKIKGSSWSGAVVGDYSTELTPEGYAVESFTEKGSVQIYPAAALEKIE